MKTNKGFTLIEIMIAIAIIGILALVLIPRVSTMKTQAKLAGLDTNMRVAQGIIESMVNDYTTSQIPALETNIALKLPTDISNPITQASGTIAVGGATTLPFILTTADDTAATLPAIVSALPSPDAATITGAADANAKGAIKIVAYASGTQLKVALLPFDDQGNIMSSKIKVVEK